MVRAREFLKYIFIERKTTEADGGKVVGLVEGARRRGFPTNGFLFSQ